MKFHFVLGLACAAVVLGLCPVTDAAVPTFTMVRTTTSGGVYNPGEALDVNVTLELTGEGVPTAIGVADTLPVGWTFDSIISGDAPNIVPQMGWGGLLEFSWYPLPAFPVSFVYRVNTPEDTQGSLEISGEATCRIRDVGPLSSGIVTTDLNRPGALQVVLEPAGARLAGAQWAVSGGAWQDSNVILDSVPAGLRTVTFSTIPGWTAPDSIQAAIVQDQVTTITGTYTESSDEGQTVEGQGQDVLPTAAFRAGPTSGDAPLSVEFADESIPGTAAITAWFWDFGDGDSSVAQHPTHVYNTPGTYRVTLLVTSASGADSEIKLSYIVVNQGSVLEGETIEGETVEGAPVEGGTVEGDATEGQTLEGAPVEGETVDVLPVAAFRSDIISGTAPIIVEFTDESAPGTKPITSWAWDFGDGASSSAQHPSHLYGLPGIYRVTLLVITAAGSDSEIKEGYITVADSPEGEIVEGETVEGEILEGEILEGQAPEGQPREGQAVDGEPAEGQSVDGQDSEGEPAPSGGCFAA